MDRQASQFFSDSLPGVKRRSSTEIRVLIQSGEAAARRARPGFSSLRSHAAAGGIEGPCVDPAPCGAITSSPRGGSRGDAQGDRMCCLDTSRPGWHGHVLMPVCLLAAKARA